MLVQTDTHAITDQIIGCAIEVHSTLGPGLLESLYETAMSIEMTHAELSFKRQAGMPLYYKGQLISEHRVDLVVEDARSGEASRKSNGQMPSRPQQLGLILFLAALIVYVIARVGW